jgi:hypothetical protein
MKSQYYKHASFVNNKYFYLIFKKLYFLLSYFILTSNLYLTSSYDNILQINLKKQIKNSKLKDFCIKNFRKIYIILRKFKNN